MKNNVLKSLVKKTLFPDGSQRKIRFGPMKGLTFRINKITGISPWYSGPEREHQDLFARVLAPGDCVFDIGANWGLHTIYIARLVGENGAVHAFEPAPEVAEETRWHAKANGFSHVNVHELALSDINGETSFVTEETSATSHISEIRGSESGDGSSAITVQVRTLDSIIDDFNVEKIKLMKIDVEGAESRMLEGAEQTIKRYRPHLVIDLHTPEQDLAVAAMLDGWGYTITRVNGEKIPHLDRPWPDPEGVWGSIHASPGQ